MLDQNFKRHVMKIRSRMVVMTMKSTRRASTTMILRMIVCVAFFMILHQITSLFLIHLRSSSSSRISSTNIPEKLTSQLITTNHLKAIRKQSFQQQNRPRSTQPLINCDKTHKLHDICVLNMPTTLDPNTYTFYVFDPFSNPTFISKPEVHKIRPYPRKLDSTAMSQVKELTLITTSSTTKIHCQIQHQAPALVFSAEGYTGNLSHDFNDGIIPLFVTIRSLFPDGDYPILVVSTSNDWWFNKYAELLERFTLYPIIYLENSTETHCFPSTTTIGLISHGFMTINSTLLPSSDGNFLGFRSLLGASYDGITEHNWPIRKHRRKRPIVVLVGRMASAQVGRVILNQADVEFLAKRVGFEVAVFEPNAFQSLSQAYELINKSHAMVGVHGAALTHSLFLRPGSVFIQVVPLGVDWLAETYYGNSAKEMRLEYMKYKIEAKESSLAEKYGKNHLALKNPMVFMKNNWSIQRDVYLREQNVRIDLVRFGKYLKSAYKKAKHFMAEMG
ncbi:uncharacterized protein LOC113331611 [Papaver somniferum]|uniref:uncharacterized protein LOC113331611 n=1 Tax=Papaver somniferum TaxID=3469 RepID=UPI000E6FB31F|nr:uncharacterized protein LOC113331611 [Papaver somniferum]